MQNQPPVQVSSQPPAIGKSSTGLEENVAALLSYIFTWVSGLVFFVMEKDSKRFAEEWAYFSFEGQDGKPVSKAQPFPKNRCWSCHDQKAATDNVFTQFYPVLRAVAPKQ